MQIVRAVVENGALWPLESLGFAPGTEVRAIVRAVGPAEEREAVEERLRLLEELTELLRWHPLTPESPPPTLEW